MSQQQPAPATRLVVGIGSTARGDDGVGPAVAWLVADELEARGVHDVLVVAHEDPTALVDLMTGLRGVVIIDALHSGAPPGRVQVHAVTGSSPALPATTSPGAAGTHGLGVAHALELARALDRLPTRLCLVGVEGRTFETGHPLSPEVAAALHHAVTAVLACLEEM